MARQTEIEVEEKEVEYVYCDECGDECTDEYRYKPMEVCFSCSDETAVRRIASLPTHFDEDTEVIPLYGIVFFSIIFPIVTIIVFFATRDDVSKSDYRASLLFTIGGLLWGAIIAAAIILIYIGPQLLPV